MYMIVQRFYVNLMELIYCTFKQIDGALCGFESVLLHLVYKGPTSQTYCPVQLFLFTPPKHPPPRYHHHHHQQKTVTSFEHTPTSFARNGMAWHDGWWSATQSRVSPTKLAKSTILYVSRDSSDVTHADICITLSSV